MDHRNDNLISIHELLEASKFPPESAEIKLLKEKIISNYLKYDLDDELQGAINFLVDHDFDFVSLHNFLNSKLNLNETNRRKSSSKTYATTLVISLSITIVSLTVLYFYNSTKENKILSDFVIYEPGMPVFATMDSNKEFNNLMSNFKLNNFKQGIQYYYIIREKYTNNDTLNYYAAWLYFKNEQYDSSSQLFSKLTNIKSIFFQKANYMNAISLFLNKEEQRALTLFEIIAADSANLYSANAKKILANN